jgi:phage protein U/cytoskeletal protein CcmA (bactofilin family)
VGQDPRVQGEEMAVGRISGPLLKSNLLRNGVDLAFENDLLYLDVTNQRIGVRTASPEHELDIVGTTRTTNIIVDTQASIGQLSITNNTIQSPENITLITAEGDKVIVTGPTEIADVRIASNVISTLGVDTKLEVRPTGSLDVYADTNITGDLFVLGNTTIDGDVVLGTNTANTVRFDGEVSSNLVPTTNNLYSLGTELRRWKDVRVETLTATSVVTGDLIVDGINLALRQGNILFVAANGDDSNTGTHINDPFRSVKKALTEAESGDTIHIFPGIYEEIFPLTVPVGVTVKGQSIRSVFIKPTLATQNNDAFLLNGETTVEDLTVGNFYSPGYGFKFAPGFSVSSRSPYIKNITVITEGTVKTQEDPRGFNAGDAGRGAFLDGSVAGTLSNEASGLFHSVTFITPGVDAIFLTNGVRIEWLNCFTYFANSSIYAEDGATGLKGQGQTSLRVSEVTGTISVGNTIEYYDFDGVTLIESAEIVGIDSTGKISVAGKQTGFEKASERGGKNVQAFGDAKLSTAVKKFGTASLSLDGVGDYAFVQSNTDFTFGTDDFTIEGWVYRETTGVAVSLFDFRTAATQTAPWLYVGAGGGLLYVVNSTNRISTSGSTIGAGSWIHIALSRSGTDTRLFVNGTQVGSTYTDTNDYIQSPLTIGARYTGANDFFNGYIDDLRIVKGAAIYTANFTPPVGTLPVTSTTVLMLRFNGENESVNFADDVVYQQDIRFSSGATAKYITLTDFSDFGAEVRLIGSASVYGNFGLVGDGPGVIMYAIGHNVAYVGSGLKSDNDPLSSIQSQEIIQENDAKIFYSSVNHRGDFRVGDLFYVNQEDGTVQFTSASFNINTTEGLTLTDGTNFTIIDGTAIQTGNWKISGNTIETLSGDANITSASDLINFNNNVNIDGNLTVSGDITVAGNIQIGNETSDTIEIVARIGSDLIPETTASYDIGSSSLRWNELWIGQANIDAIRIDSNVIETVTPNTSLVLQANGTGIISIPLNDVEINEDLTVNGTTNLKNTFIVGNLTQTGDVVQTGNILLTGNLTADGDVTVSNLVQSKDIKIENNIVSTTLLNTDLTLRAVGSNRVLFPSNDVEISQNLTVNGTVYTQDIESSGTITADTFTTGDILIDNNVIRTTLTNSNLLLQANGTGIVSIPTNNLVAGQNLTVIGSTFLANTGITGTLTHVGDTNQTGNITLTGNYTVNGNLTVDEVAQFKNIRIENNVVSTTVTNSDLILRANGTGRVVLPLNNFIIEEDLQVVGTANIQNLNAVDVVSDTFSTGDIQIFDNVIRTTLANSNLSISANGTGEVRIENFSFSNNTVSTHTGEDIIIQPGPGKVVKLNSIESVTLPKGTTAQRPSLPEAGMVRFNTDINQYEGYDGTSWIRLQGVYDSDYNTYITAELTPGANDNVIRFYADGDLIADIDSQRLNTEVLQVNDIQIYDNVIETYTANSNLLLRANGTGSVNIENFSINGNIITNTVSNSITEFRQANGGYFKIDSTRAFVVPIGTSSQRPANTEVGMVRFNTELLQMEVFEGTQWTNVAGLQGAITSGVAEGIAIETVLILG